MLAQLVEQESFKLEVVDATSTHPIWHGNCNNKNVGAAMNAVDSITEVMMKYYDKAMVSKEWKKAAGICHALSRCYEGAESRV